MLQRLTAVIKVVSIAAALSVGAVSAVGAQVLGEAEGDSRDLVCGRGEIVTSFVARHGSRIDAVGISCARVDIADPRAPKAVRPVLNSDVVGGRGGVAQSVWCPTGWAPFGVSGAWLASHRDLATLQLRCKPMAYDPIIRRLVVVNCPPDPSAGGRPLCKSSVRLGGRAPGVSPGERYCPDQEIMIGLRVWVDESPNPLQPIYVNAVQPICGWR